MMRSARLHKLSELEIKNAPYQEKDYTISDGGNLYLNVRQYEAKEWLFRYTSPVTGKRRNTSLGRYPDISRADARKIASQNRALLEQQLDPIIETEKQRQTEEKLHRQRKTLERNTVEAVFHEWKQAELKNRKDGGAEIERTFVKDVFPLIGSKPISAVIRDDVKDILNRPLKRGSNRMANRMLSDLRQFFGYTLDEEYLEKDPTARMRKDRVGGKEEARERFLNKEERKAFAQALPKSGLLEKYQDALWIILSTGCRVSELSKAQWKNVNFEKQTFKIPSYDAKNKTAHTVYLSDFALNKFKRLYEARTSETWIFPSRDGESHINRRTISKQVTDRQQEIPINGRTKDHDTLILSGGHWTVHDLRRTAATTMQELGVFPHIIQKCLNQTVDDPIMQTYQRSELKNAQKEAFEKLGEYLESALKTA
tara:strand:- start:22014 stop:23291 length:1278 start_codon:yes stop_codon:yes gene_type:complete